MFWREAAQYLEPFTYVNPRFNGENLDILQSAIWGMGSLAQNAPKEEF